MGFVYSSKRLWSWCDPETDPCCGLDPGSWSDWYICPCMGWYDSAAFIFFCLVSTVLTEDTLCSGFSNIHCFPQKISLCALHINMHVLTGTATSTDWLQIVCHEKFSPHVTSQGSPSTHACTHVMWKMLLFHLKALKKRCNWKGRQRVLPFFIWTAICAPSDRRDGLLISTSVAA